MRAHTSFIGREDFNGRLVTVVYYETRTFLMGAQIFYICADILDRRKCHGRKHFMGANISWAQIFHGRKYFNRRRYFMGANISWAQIFHGREYFEVCIHFRLEVNILCVNYYFRQAPIFNDFCSQFCQFYSILQ